jgi:hypothetical protein
MAERRDVQELLGAHPGTAVSIVTPLEPDRPQNLEDPRRLRALIERALDGLSGLDGAVDRVAIVEQLTGALGEIEAQLAHPTPGLALFASATERRWVPLTQSVPERVVVGGDFVVRDLLADAQDLVAMHVLVLAQDEARLFALDGDELHAVHEHGFPLHLDAARERDKSHRDLPVHETEHDDVKALFRVVDRAVTAADGNRPLIVVAPARDLSLFREASHHADRIAGTVHGNHVHTALDRLRDLVEPARLEHLAQRRAVAVGVLRDALDARLAATEPLEAWRAAHDGRGRLLLVDRDYELHGQITADHLEWIEGDSTSAPDVVEAIVESVLGHGGEVVFTRAGELPDGLRLGLVLRY